MPDYRTILTKYHPTTTETQYIKTEIYYTIGNCKTNRGFYLSVRPVTKDGPYEISRAFSDCSQFLLPCSRYSKKAGNIAIGKIPDFEPDMVTQMLQTENLTLATDLSENKKTA